MNQARLTALALALCLARAAAAGSLLSPEVAANPPFVVGVNYPWYQEAGQHYYGQSFGGLTEARKHTIASQLDEIAGTGVRAIRIWTLAAGGPWLDLTTPLPASTIEDLRWFIRAAHQRGMGVMPSIWDFYLNKTHRPLIEDAAARAKLISLYVEPLVRALSAEPGLLAWDLCNEPEWMVRWVPWGKPGDARGPGSDQGRPPGAPDHRWPDVGPGHSLSAIRAFLSPQIEAIHRAGGRVTIGAVSPWTVRLWKGMGLDEYHVHFYPPDATAFLGDAQYFVLPAVKRLGLDRPCTLAEFAPNGRHTHLVEILKMVRDRGYAGAWAWAYFGVGFPEDMTHPFSFRAREADFRAFTQSTR